MLKKRLSTFKVDKSEVHNQTIQAAEVLQHEGGVETPIYHIAVVAQMNNPFKINKSFFSVFLGRKTSLCLDALVSPYISQQFEFG